MPNTKITRARFAVALFPVAQMRKIGQALTDSIHDRIKSGLNVHDAPAKSLSEAYARRKAKRGRAPVRDLFWTGRTLNSLKLKSVSSERGVIGFADPLVNVIVNAQNKKELIFGLSPSDRRVLNQAVTEALKENPLVKTVQL